MRRTCRDRRPPPARIPRRGRQRDETCLRCSPGASPARATSWTSRKTAAAPRRARADATARTPRRDDAGLDGRRVLEPGSRTTQLRTFRRHDLGVRRNGDDRAASSSARTITCRSRSTPVILQRRASAHRSRRSVSRIANACMQESLEAPDSRSGRGRQATFLPDAHSLRAGESPPGSSRPDSARATSTTRFPSSAASNT